MVSRAIASIAALLLRHLAPEMYSAAGYTLPNYHPYQVARHLAAEISAEAALRVIALPHTEGPLHYLLGLLCSLGLLIQCLLWLLGLLCSLGLRIRWLLCLP